MPTSQLSIHFSLICQKSVEKRERKIVDYDYRKRELEVSVAYIMVTMTTIIRPRVRARKSQRLKFNKLKRHIMKLREHLMKLLMYCMRNYPCCLIGEIRNCLEVLIIKGLWKPPAAIFFLLL